MKRTTSVVERGDGNRQEGERNLPGTTAALNSQSGFLINRRGRGDHRGRGGASRQNVTPRSLWSHAGSTVREEGQVMPTESGSSLSECQYSASSRAEVFEQLVQELVEDNNVLNRMVTSLEGDLLECKTVRKAV